MLAGVAFLLVAAAQAGLFPPVARVVAAAVLAAVLVGLGLRLQARHETRAARDVTGDAEANPGALALVGTGIAAAILDVIACTSLYGWIPTMVAYLLVAGLAVAGMGLALRWSSGLLACLVSAGTMLLSPSISTGVELPCFLVILAVATAVLGAGLGTPVRLVWSVLPAPVLIGYLVEAPVHDRSGQTALIVAALVFAVVGSTIAWLDAMRRSPALENAALVVIPTALPLLVIPAVPMIDPGWPVALWLAAAYLIGSYPAGRRPAEAEPLLLSAVLGLVGTTLLFSAWVRLDDLDQTYLAVTLSATAYVIAAGLSDRRWVDWAGGVGAVLSVVLYLEVAEPFRVFDAAGAVRFFGPLAVADSVALIVLALAVTWWARRRLPRESTAIAILGAVVALSAFSVAIVTLGVVLGKLFDDARGGFLASHPVVTMLWICLAAWLVLARRTPVPDSRRLGFVLGALALAKLLFLDLATLPGLFRVLSFIAVGAVMLAVAVRYRGGGPDGPSGADYRSETEPSGNGAPT